MRPDFKDSVSTAEEVEFVNRSVSSFGIAEMIGQDLTELGRRLMPHVSPHIVYLDLKPHVYTKVTVSPTQSEDNRTLIWMYDTSRSE
jgi:hypothetical protein